jgi:hypothetical protein
VLAPQPTPFQHVPPYLHILPAAAAGDAVEAKASGSPRDDVSSGLLEAWRVSASMEPALAATITAEGDGVDDVQQQSIAKLDYLIAFLRDEGERTLRQAEEGADPLVKMRDEVDTLLEALSAIETEVVQLQNERVRVCELLLLLRVVVTRR